MNSAARTLRIVVADDEPDMRQFLREILMSVGHQVLVASDGNELIDVARRERPNLIITDERMPGRNGLEAIAALSPEFPVPVIVITGHPEANLLQNESPNVMACLSKPVKPADLIAAITLATARFDQFQQMAQQAENLRQALDDRKIIERAKGNVVRRLHIDEEEAFRRLQRVSSERNCRMIEIARQIIAADEVY